MCRLDNLILISVILSNIGTLVMLNLYLKQSNKIKKLDKDLNEEEKSDYCMFRHRIVIFNVGGIKARLARMEKQKAIIAELCDYVYKSK